jgi:hypothetical protein
MPGQKEPIQVNASGLIAEISGMTPAERGIYFTVIMFMALDRRPLSKDMVKLARVCGCSKIAVTRAIKSLLWLGAIQEVDGMLTHDVLSTGRLGD